MRVHTPEAGNDHASFVPQQPRLVAELGGVVFAGPGYRL
jgi:hypothetical protein